MTIKADCVIRRADLDDLPAIKKLADSHKQELGFVRWPVLARSIGQSEVYVAENGEGIIGFLQYHHRRDRQTTLHNIAVRLDYRNCGIGRKMTMALEVESQTKGKSAILLKCPEDLPANSFYAKMGYEKVNVESGKARRLNIWQKIL